MARNGTQKPEAAGLSHTDQIPSNDGSEASSSDATPELPPIPVPAAGRRVLPEGLPLMTAVREFYRHVSPWMVTLAAFSATTARLWTGQWQALDLAVVAVILAVWPLQEWIFHVVFLHFKPMQLGTAHIDLPVAIEHRKHHQDPADLRFVFIPLHIVIPGLPLLFLASFLIPDPGLSLTALAFYYWLALAYEWTHYLMHTPYRPRSKFYRYLWRNHRLHHYKNEHYWFGILAPFIDTPLRTAPDHRSVPVSPTCRNVLAADASARRAG